MSSPHPTATWEAMPGGGAFYSKQQAYIMQWQGMHDLSDYIICGARCGGPLAMMRDTSKLSVVTAKAPSLTRSQVQIWSLSGEGLLLLTWETKVMKMGWTSGEKLVLLNEEGLYRLYDLRGNYEQFSLGGEAAETGIIDAQIWEEGMVILTGALNFVELHGWGKRATRLANAGIIDPPRSWSLLPPSSSPTSHTQVIISILSTPSLLLLDSLECVDQRVSKGPFSHISYSPNGKYLALLTLEGILWVVSSDFGSSMAEWNSRENVYLRNGVRQVEWCGNDAVALSSTDGTTILIGPLGDTLTFPFSSPVYLRSEIDSVRITSPLIHTIVQKVPNSILRVFEPGSTHPAATLFDAWSLFSEKERQNSAATRVEQSLRRIRQNGEIAGAVDECIQAAGGLWDSLWQQRLLEAARFGQSYLTLFNPSDFIRMARSLRVLNAVRFYKVGIPLTNAQFSLDSPDVLIQRLTDRNRHLLAFRISRFLGLEPDSVLKHWASSKVATPLRSSETGISEDQRDNILCNSIVAKFEEFGGKNISYSEVARKAWEVGKNNLATKLLDHESRAADQVPLLLQMREDKLALLKAVDSGDTDLVHTVLLTLQSRYNMGNFFGLLDSSQMLYPARKLLEHYARAQNRDLLRDFYYADDRRVESAILALEEAETMTDFSSHVNSVKTAQKFLSEDKDRAFESKIMGDYGRLLTFQYQFDQEDKNTESSNIGLSLVETIERTLLLGLSRRAEKLKHEFKISDKQYWHLKLRACTAIGDFVGLENFTANKKSPIGYEPFVQHLIETDHPKEAAAYVARCDTKKRVELYARCGEWRKAGLECKAKGDRAGIEQLRHSCTDALALRELDQLLVSMT